MNILEIIEKHKIAVSPSPNNSLGRWAANCWSVGFTIPENYFGDTLEEAVLKCYNDVVVNRNITEYDLTHRIIRHRANT